MSPSPPNAPPSTRLEAAMMRTVLYGDVFDFPMTVEEIHHFLIHNEPVSLDQVRHTLETSVYLRDRLCTDGEYIALIDRQYLRDVRAERTQAVRESWPRAMIWGRRLATLPFVRMVGLTGAMAMQNPSGCDDDLDFLLVTEGGRVWLARAFAVLLVRLGRLHGVEICPNYVVAEDRLEQSRRDLYIAHEVTQVVPLYGEPIYHRLREDNPWAQELLPNASGVFYRASEQHPGRLWSMMKRSIELLLCGPLGNLLENWEYRRKLRRFSGDMRTPDSAAQLDNSSVKGHFNDHGHPVLNRYHERLRLHGLEPGASLRAAGD